MVCVCVWDVYKYGGVVKGGRHRLGRASRIFLFFALLGPAVVKYSSSKPPMYLRNVKKTSTVYNSSKSFYTVSSDHSS